MVKKIKKRKKKGEKKSPDSRSHKPVDPVTTKGSGGGSLDLEPSLPSRFAAEQMNRLIGKILSEHEFEDFDEANAFLQEHIMGHPLDEIMAEREPDSLEEAQALAYQAMEADDSHEALDLARRALRLDPGCVDALRMKALLTSRSVGDGIEGLSRVLRRAEQALGEEFFEENRGEFWSIIETRPYMRTREELVQLLLAAGREDEAVGHCEAMLDLNPHDNQGIRDTLIGLYLTRDDLKGANKLLDKYPGEHFAVFAWGRVLERYLSGDLRSAAKALKNAHKNNPYVRDFLTGKEPFPDRLPEYYKWGDVSEAVVCWSEIGPAWKKHPEAIEWLKTK